MLLPPALVTPAVFFPPPAGRGIGGPYNQGMMRIAAVWAVLPVLLFAADSRIDHVTIAGTDLKQLQARLAAIGIASVYGGPHSNHATEMSLVSFPDGSYLELMG